jgi:hypothetical protein
VEGGSGGLTVSWVSRNRGSFVKCVAIQKRLGIPVLHGSRSVNLFCIFISSTFVSVSRCVTKPENSYSSYATQ